MAISRISVKKSPLLKKKLELIEGRGLNLAESPHFEVFKYKCFRYWDNHIYQVFNKRLRLGLPISNQLKYSLRISCSKNDAISFSMKHLKHSGAPGESGGKTNDYGRYLRGKSDTGGRGTYLQWLFNRKAGQYRLFDKKIKRGETKPVNKQYWKRWMFMFKPTITKYTIDMVEKIYKDVNDGHI